MVTLPPLRTATEIFAPQASLIGVVHKNRTPIKENTSAPLRLGGSPYDFQRFLRRGAMEHTPAALPEFLKINDRTAQKRSHHFHRRHADNGEE